MKYLATPAGGLSFLIADLVKKPHVHKYNGTNHELDCSNEQLFESPDEWHQTFHL